LAEQKNNLEQNGKGNRLGQAVGFFRKKLFIRFILIFLLTLLISFLLSPNLSAPLERYKVGQFTNDTIRAPYDFSFENSLATERNRKHAYRNSPPIANLDTNLQKKTSIKLLNAFTKMREIYLKGKQMATVPKDELRKLPKSKRNNRKEEAQKAAKEFTKKELADAYPGFEDIIGVSLDKSQKSLLEKEKFQDKFYVGIKLLLERAYQTPITLDSDEISREMAGVSPERTGNPGKLMVKEIGTDTVNIAGADYIFNDINVIQRELSEKAPEILKSFAPAVIDLVLKITNANIKPNLILNRSETDTGKEAAAQAVLPVYFKFQKNQLIIGEGQEITEETLQIFEYLSARKRPKNFLNNLFGYGIFIYMLIILGFWIADINEKSYIISDHDFIFIAASLALTVLFFKIWQFIIGGVVDLKPEIPGMALLLLFPLA